MITRSPSEPLASGVKTRPGEAASPRRRGLVSDVLSNLPIWQKLLLIALAFTLPIGVVLSLLISQQNSRIALAAQEIQGAQFLGELGALVQKVPQHRGITNTLLSGNTSVADRRESLAVDIGASLASLLVLAQQVDFVAEADIAALQAAWEGLERDLFVSPPAEVFDRHTQFMSDELFSLLTEVTNESGLVLDPALDTTYVVQLVTQDLPLLTEVMGRMRGFGSGLLARGEMSADERSTLEAMHEDVRFEFAAIDQALGFALEENPALEGTLGALADTAAPLGLGALALTEEAILQAPSLTYDSTGYFNAQTEAIDAYLNLYNASLVTLQGLLQERIQVLQRQQLVQLIIIALVLALTFALVGVVVHRITDPVASLFRASERLSKGDLNVVVPVGSTDELGALTKNFNAATARLREASERDQAELERSKALQQNIGGFLEVAMDIADGDFTKRGQVSEDALGNVVDAINLMVEELAYLLTQTRDAALSVNQGSSEMADITDAVTRSARRQAEEAQGARERALAVTASIRKMAENADTAARASARTLQASAQGEEAVANTLKGMASIRNEVQAIAERSESLRSRSDEISEVVKAMSHIASQINLLALNAALEAAGAGEAGARFATVAAEVQALADEAAAAAQQVGALVRNIQTEIKEVSQSVRGGSQEVEAGYKVATEAGERLQEIAQIATQSAELVRSMSAATQEQVSGVEGVSSSIVSIAQLSDQAQGRVREGRDAAARLQALSNELTENLSRFRLA